MTHLKEIECAIKCYKDNMNLFPHHKAALACLCFTKDILIQAEKSKEFDSAVSCRFSTLKHRYAQIRGKIK